MDAQIALWLIQDGLTNGAVYALLGIATVLVFAVTRIIFVPQGEFVTFGALTLALLQTNKTPGSVWMVLWVALAAAALLLYRAWRQGDLAMVPSSVFKLMAFPLVTVLLVVWLAPRELALGWDIALTLALITSLGPLLYRLVYEPLADASVLVLLIASVALHFALSGLALVFFGPEGFKTPPFTEFSLALGAIKVPGQTLVILLVATVLIVAMAIGFGYTLYGKALRATAFNRIGARLIGFSPTSAGSITFGFAAFLGAASGVLIGPLVTIYYDSGFVIGLKGFVGAIIGGLASYPMTALGSVLVGILESFSSFWASAYKEVIVFTMIIPVLIWLSLTHVAQEEEK